MAQVSTYLNFERNTEEAFNFYKSVFGTEFVGGIMRHGDVPVPEGQPGRATTTRTWSSTSRCRSSAATS